MNKMIAPLTAILAIAVVIVSGLCVDTIKKGSYKQIEKVEKTKAELAYLYSATKKAEEAKIETSATWVLDHSTRISETVAKQIAKEAFKYPNPILILSLIEVESEFTPTAVSKAGAVGLGQIMYDIHKKDMTMLGINKRRDLFDIDKNIKTTSFILQMMIKRNNGDIMKALHLYLGEKDGKYVSRIFSNYVYLSIRIEDVLPKM